MEGLLELLDWHLETSPQVKILKGVGNRELHCCQVLMDQDGVGRIASYEKTSLLTVQLFNRHRIRFSSFSLLHDAPSPLH